MLLPSSISHIPSTRKFQNPDKSTVNDVRVTSCSDDFSKNKGRVRIVGKNTVLMSETTGFHQ